MEKKIQSRLFVYVDTLTGDIVGSFYSRSELEAKRFLMSLCFDALEKCRFNLGALSVFIQRDVLIVDLEKMEKHLFVKMSDLVNDAVSSLQDQSNVIRIKNDVDVGKN